MRSKARHIIPTSRVKNLTQAWETNKNPVGLEVDETMLAFLRSRRMGQVSANGPSCARTVREYEYDLVRFTKSLRERQPELKHWGEIKKETVQDILEELQANPDLRVSSKYHVYRTLRALFYFIEKSEECKQQQMQSFRVLLPKIGKNPSKFYLPSPATVRRLLDNGFDKTLRWGLRDFTVACLILDTGARIGAVCEMKVDDIKWDIGMVRLYATSSEECFVPVSKDSTLSLLKKWLREREKFAKTDRLFINKFGGACAPNTFDQSFHKALLRARIDPVTEPLTPHTLRHYFCTHYLVNGGGIHNLQRISGHKQVSTLMIYVHMSEQLGTVVEEHSRVSPLLTLGNTKESRKRNMGY